MAIFEALIHVNYVVIQLLSLKDMRINKRDGSVLYRCCCFFVFFSQGIVSLKRNGDI